MSMFLILADLFFMGSVIGWVLEVFFRKNFSSSNPNHKWINPGFCVGPYIPLYGFGLCILYLLAVLGEYLGIDKKIMFLTMALSMTAIEYIAGILCLKMMNLRLWDYSGLWGNIQGLICPLFSFFWAILGAVYYYFIHSRILYALNWLGENLAFSFVIGFFFGVFTLDVIYSAKIVSKIRKFAQENDIVVKYEALKSDIHRHQEQFEQKIRFFFPFRTELPLTHHMQEMLKKLKKD